MNSSNENIRELIKGYLVVCNSKPIILTTNQKNATECFVKCKNIDNKASITDFTTHVERFKEIGRNIFTPIPATQSSNIVEFRNKIIKDWQNTVDSIPKSNPEVVWQKVAKKYSISNATSGDFSQWILDHMKYNQRCV